MNVYVKGVMPRMNKEFIIDAEVSYRQAEKMAAEYLTSLQAQVTNKTYVPILMKDIQNWKQNHIRPFPLLSLFSRRKKKTAYDGYHTYIQWLNYTGKLENYLDRSISYIFMRDLGKALDSPETKERISQVVASLQKQLTDTTKKAAEPFSMVGAFRMAQNEGVESTMIWVMKQIRTVIAKIPEGMDAEQAQRKLIKIIAGVIMHENEEMHDGVPPEERSQRFDRAIRLGYAYGLTYPFIDDLLDAKVLSDREKEQYADLIRTTLTIGSVPELKKWDGDNFELIRYVHGELRNAFEYIKSQQLEETKKSFFEQSYVFFHSQEVDREKELTNSSYTNEELYIPIILKSASSRLIARSVTSASEDEGFDNRTFYYGIYNQLADDFADMFDDMKEGSVTPYTYYMKYHKERPDLINPFELYWTVIANLIHNVYQSDEKTCEVILDRAINGLKRFKKRMGNKKYDEVMALFATGNPEFNRLIQKMVRKADDVDFFDKLLRDHVLNNLRNERKERERFAELVEAVRIEINDMLHIPKSNNASLTNDPIADAANYSLEGDGKRIRPIMTMVMGVNGYGLDQNALAPLLKSLEYMHSASLIFDDLPSQDNASIRRGRPTLHEVYNNAIAELAGLFLTQKAVEEQASLDQFDAKKVLKLIHYSAQTTSDMCKGQAMDLNSKGKRLTLDQLEQLSFYKTSIAFEASLLMPAILANADEAEMNVLKKFARHAGIAFQIKDDLLDVEGDSNLLGKNIGKDAENNNSTFVSVLGIDGAEKAMWEHYCTALETLQDVPRETAFLKHILDYMVNRDY